MKKLVTLCLLTILSVATFAEIITVKASANGTGTTTWTKSNTYILDGFVFVNEGQTLTIEAGTVVKGKAGTGAEASALIVARGGKLMAEGTEKEPIVFTAQADNMEINLDARGLWGGVIILGKATMNGKGGVGQIEGIPSTEPRGAFGGTDDADNSGVLKYASIRYSGTNIGANNEINGLTMGAVGSGTTISHVEVVYNADDGFEWFGGTVKTSNLISAFNDDDCFDYDEGFRGKGQFWFAYQAPGVGDKAGEHDGGVDPEDAAPYSIPHIYNVTYVGSGDNATSSSAAVQLRDFGGGHYANGIFYGFKNTGIEIEDLAADKGNDSRIMFEKGDLSFKSNMFYNIGDNSVAKVIKSAFASSIIDSLSNKNSITDPQITISRKADSMTDPRPLSKDATTNLTAAPADVFFKTANYKGAFEPNGKLWTDGWSFISKFGFIKTTTTSIDEEAKNLSQNLLSNYPNPFNPSTTIQFKLDNSAKVNLTVFDVSGKEIAQLVNSQLHSGVHSVNFSGADLPSGIYFYTLKVGNQAVSKKMLLTK